MCHLGISIRQKLTTFRVFTLKCPPPLPASIILGLNKSIPLRGDCILAIHYVVLMSRNNEELWLMTVLGCMHLFGEHGIVCFIPGQKYAASSVMFNVAQDSRKFLTFPLLLHILQKDE